MPTRPANPALIRPAVTAPAATQLPSLTGVRPLTTAYTFEDAVASGAFGQLDLVGHGKFASLASSRGIHHVGREKLEWLDKQGALRPIGFLTDPGGAPTLHSERFTRWDRYARDTWGHPTIDALYSPWQLLYLDSAVNGRYASVDLAEYLDTQLDVTPKPRSLWRRIAKRSLQEWKRLDETWHPTILLLTRIQNRYFPGVRGTLITAPGDDPYRREIASFDPHAVAAEFGMSGDDIRAMYEWLSFRGTVLDPAKSWFPIFRSLSYREQERFTGMLRRAHDYYDAAAMLRRWYRDMTGEILPDSDELAASPDARPTWLGHERRMTYDRQDVRRFLDHHGVYPNRVHVLVEGDTEEAVLEKIILAFRPAGPSAIGVKIEPFAGVGNVTDRLLQISSYAREAVLVADNEGDLARTVETLQKSGDLENLHLRLCAKNFEEDNLSIDELVDVAHAAAKAQGVEISLTPEQLRLRQADEQRARGRNARGLASLLTQMLKDPAVGPVRLSKVDLGKAIAQFLLDMLAEAEDPEAIIEARPILKLGADIVRVTSR